MNEIQKLAIVLNEKITAQKIAEVLPSNGQSGGIKRFIRLCCNAINANPYLLECDRTSLFTAIINAAATGLSPDPMAAHLYFVPFKKKVQCIIGYRGLMSLAYRSERILSFFAEIVRVSDKFEYQLGTESFLKHVPIGLTTSPITHVYAIATIACGQNHPIKEMVVLRNDEVEASRKKSSSSASPFSPWITNYPAMAKKTAIRQLAKFLPMTTEMNYAITLDEQAEVVYSETTEDAIMEKVGLNKAPEEKLFPAGTCADDGIEMALGGMGGEAGAPIQRADAPSIPTAPANKKYDIKKIETDIIKISERGSWHILTDISDQYYTMDATVKKFAEDAIKNKWRVIISFEDRRDKKIIELIERSIKA